MTKREQTYLLCFHQHSLQTRSMPLPPAYASTAANRRSRVNLIRCIATLLQVIKKVHFSRWPGAVWHEIMLILFSRNRPGGLSTFPPPVWPLRLSGPLWLSGSSASTCRGGDGILLQNNTGMNIKTALPAFNFLLLLIGGSTEPAPAQTLMGVDGHEDSSVVEWCAPFSPSPPSPPA